MKLKETYELTKALVTYKHFDAEGHSALSQDGNLASMRTIEAIENARRAAMELLETVIRENELSQLVYYRSETTGKRIPGFVAINQDPRSLVHPFKLDFHPVNTDFELTGETISLFRFPEDTSRTLSELRRAVANLELPEERERIKERDYVIESKPKEKENIDVKIPVQNLFDNELSNKKNTYEPNYPDKEIDPAPDEKKPKRRDRDDWER